ncbi:Pyruvate/2-oxoglutarate dehydrogenase complex, dihydrolipoamide dehydrogenase (E3) component [Filomicrobium insigne]|uniref:Pyruvate/2-oxoglutarate dehydrogenase complex, dihydrolipoamide dehydrogenase (E3) component n=1 Tax=Filomicrobium insigne TaxID=418854 RepID=A0A1H0U154_9HYPH|nr:FAD-dependent oxidoreductase [Filomicrobium insigne]SDP59987.1 Pyruvate/2-oxoglutarate dehydrogenase complex, dihydrolipoamide dehydrogenase (E3) component [Filomicrobium insigne]
MPPSDPSTAAYSNQLGVGSDNHAGAGNGGSADVTTKGAPTDLLQCDICIIGAGSGGLSVAAAAAAFGQNVVLIEKHKMGGDCLNYGCVPSKALIAASRRAHMIRTSAQFGVMARDLQIDPEAVSEHIKGVIAAIEPNDSIERFTGLGVRVITAAGHFTDKSTVSAGGYRIKARRFVVATGSSPLVPNIPGLSEVPYFTNETIFDNGTHIDHLLIIGGGPIGLELAQAYRRLGSKVTVLEAARAMAKDDPEMSKIVLDHLREEGIDIREKTSVEEVDTRFRNVTLTLKKGDSTEVIEGSHLLIATGRRPNVTDVGLETAGIKYSDKGIKVNRGLVTSNRRVYAIGDVIGGAQFTHMANYHAGIVIRKALFRLPAKTDASLIPWVTFTDPELAQVGLQEEDAAKKHGKVNVLRWPYHENDRAQAERATVGHVKVVTDKSGRILGASIVGEQAGELIQMWALAISQKMNIKAMTGWISPYPTLSEINKRAAYKFYSKAPSSPLIRKAIGFLAKFG